jgi:enoyl-CoA hydratase/carnithine racemase
MSGTIACTRNGAIATVTLTNPGKLNAVDLAMWQSLATTVNTLSADDDIRCIIICGEGDLAFAAGGDLEEFRMQRDTLDHAMAYHTQVAGALRAVADCRHPTLAMIRGACIGGGLEIAGQCDLRICGESARFGAPINKLGFSMYPGEMEGLMRLAGAATVLEILLEGRIFSATEAYAKGLVTRVVPDTAVSDETLACAHRICAGAPLVAGWHKQWVRRLQQNTPLTDEELRASFEFLATDDYREGLNAFLEKRHPVFLGK